MAISSKPNLKSQPLLFLSRQASILGLQDMWRPNMRSSSFKSPRPTKILILAILTGLVYCLNTLLTGRNELERSPPEVRDLWEEQDDNVEIVQTPSRPFPNSEPEDKQTVEPLYVGLDRVGNDTLGFEKIFAIGLPERTDKRDALSLMAAMTGFKLDWVDGIKSSSIAVKAIPFGIDIGKTEGSFLGNWRGHMNAIRQVVESGVSSALILEDDVDWDLHIKSQLREVARGAHNILSESFSEDTHSPYGDNWDILWLGHCGDWFPETLFENANLEGPAKARISSKYIISNDRTVPPMSKLSDRVRWSDWAAKTRFVHRSGAPSCSFAYAVSQTAARKLLYAMSVDGLHTPFHHSLSQMCQSSVRAYARGQKKSSFNLRCITVNPTMMFHHKAKGMMEGDTDALSYGINGGVRLDGFTESVQWSTRLNLQNLLIGKKPVPQFKEPRESKLSQKILDDDDDDDDGERHAEAI